MTTSSVRIATRGSALALRQAELVRAALSRLHPGLVVDVVVVTTAGDRVSARQAARAPVGAFTREVDLAVLGERADLAVHSLKDLPTRTVPGIVLGAVPAREDPADVLCARRGETLGALPAGAVVGAGGPRRHALLLRCRPDLLVEAIRGNVDTRLRALRDEAHLDAIVVAAAGLRRLGRETAVSERFDPWDWLPAPGQGALAITLRDGDAGAASVVAGLDDRASRGAIIAERAFLAAVDAGCRAPVGALAEWREGRVRLRAMIASADGRTMLVDEISDAEGDEAELGRRLAERMLAAGGRAILEEARAEAGGGSNG